VSTSSTVTFTEPSCAQWAFWIAKERFGMLYAARECRDLWTLGDEIALAEAQARALAAQRTYEAEALAVAIANVPPEAVYAEAEPEFACTDCIAVGGTCEPCAEAASEYEFERACERGVLAALEYDGEAQAELALHETLFPVGYGR
jgi:hypothetical protein